MFPGRYSPFTCVIIIIIIIFLFFSRRMAMCRCMRTDRDTGALIGNLISEEHEVLCDQSICPLLVILSPVATRSVDTCDIEGPIGRSSRGGDTSKYLLYFCYWPRQ